MIVEMKKQYSLIKGVVFKILCIFSSFSCLRLELSTIAFGLMFKPDFDQHDRSAHHNATPNCSVAKRPHSFPDLRHYNSNFKKAAALRDNYSYRTNYTQYIFVYLSSTFVIS